MKRTLAVVLVLCVVFAFAGCGDEVRTNHKKESSKIEGGDSRVEWIQMLSEFFNNILGVQKGNKSDVWQFVEYDESDYSEQYIYVQFLPDGTVNFYENGIKYYGDYTIEENVEGQKILKSDFYVFGMSGGEGVIYKEKDKVTMTITFGDVDMKFKKSELPLISLDPELITHASADEVGLNELSVDEKIVGTWEEIMDEYYIQMGYIPMKYTFNSDGTGVMGYDYFFDENYGYGYGMEFGFKYTAKDNNVFITTKYFDGTVKDLDMQYGLDGENLVIGDVRFKKTDQ